jgi:hypothetical protein
MSRVIPWQIADAVILWARARGRTARVYWNDVVGCPTIELSCLPDDPKWVAWQEGRLRHPPCEPVFLHHHDPATKRYRAIDLEEYGADGIVAWLEEADTHSGRGSHGSLYDAVRSQIESNEATRAAHAAQIEEAGRETGWLHRRSLLELPMVSVDQVLSTTDATTTQESTP